MNAAAAVAPAAFFTDSVTRYVTLFPGATAVYLRADKETVWEPIAQVMSELGNAKLQVNAVTQPEDTANKRRK